MLAVAYRNLVERPMGLEDDTRAVRRVFSYAERNGRRRAQRLATEALLLDLMELVSGRPSSEWQPTRNQDGKPTLASTEGQTAIDVSLSHCGALALAGITDLGEIGVDLEYRAPRRSISEIAADAFGPQEQRVVESVGPGAFYRIWTLREALAKACGIGFPMLADGRDYFAQPLKAGTWQSQIDGRRWLFSTGDLPGDYVFSIALAPRAPLDADCEANLTPRQIVRGTNESKEYDPSADGFGSVRMRSNGKT
jgi:phosphopantetheinyl transferase